MGSQSEEIVHHAQVPALVIRGAEDFWPPARIVIGEDFSDDARKAGELVAAIGKLYGAQGLLVYSHPDLPEVPPGRSRVENLRRCANETKACSKPVPVSWRRSWGAGRIRGFRRLPGQRTPRSLPGSAALARGRRQQGPGRTNKDQAWSVSTKVVTAARGPVLIYPHVE